MIAPQLHFIGSVAAGAPWAGYAKKLGLKCYHARIHNKVYRLGGVEIRVQNAFPIAIGFGGGAAQSWGGSCKVWIKAGGTGDYQFIGTHDTLIETFIDPNFAGRHCSDYAATSVLLRGGALSFQPLYSNYLEDTEDPQRWFFEDDPQITYPQNRLRVNPAHQPDMRGIFQSYLASTQQPGKVSAQWIGSTWAQVRPLTGATNLPCGFVDAADAGYDYPPLLYTDGVGVPLITETDTDLTDWWRRGSIQPVTTGEWSRQIVVMVDVNNVFHAFVAGNVATTIQSVACPWPTWANPATVGKTVDPFNATEYLKEQMPLWAFHPSGTHAACVVAHRADPWTQGGVTSSHYSNAGAFVQTLQNDYPGMVEVALTLELTGPNPADFEFTVTLNRSIYSVEDQTIPGAVGYLAADMGDLPQGSLVMMEYQHYLAPISLSSNDGYEFQPYKTSYCVVSVLLDSGWLEVRRWLAFMEVWHGGDPTLTFHDFPYTIETFPEVTLNSSYGDTVPLTIMAWVTQINTVDLATLSFLMTATTTVVSTYLEPDVPGQNSSVTSTAEAACITAIVKNAVVKTELIGHSHISQYLSDMLLCIEDAQPNPSAYTRAFIDMTVDYARNASTGVVNMTVHNGGDTYTTNDLTFPYTLSKYGTYGYLNIINAYPGHHQVEQPVVAKMFDPSHRYIRPSDLLTVGSSGMPDAGATTGFSGYPAGAMHHYLVSALTQSAMADSYGNLRVHPNGSYSLCYGPIAAQTALMKQRRFAALVQIQNNYQQVLLDVLHIADEKAKKSVTTTHLNAYNKAFRTEFSASDFLYSFQKGASRFVEMRFDRTTDVPDDWFETHGLSGDLIFPIGVLGRYFSVHLFVGDSNSDDAMMRPQILPGGVIDGDYAYGVKFPMPSLRMESLFGGSA
jgi:hypothetical protein